VASCHFPNKYNRPIKLSIFVDLLWGPGLKGLRIYYRKCLRHQALRTGCMKRPANHRGRSNNRICPVSSLSISFHRPFPAGSRPAWQAPSGPIKAVAHRASRCGGATMISPSGERGFSGRWELLPGRRTHCTEMLDGWGQMGAL